MQFLELLQRNPEFRILTGAVLRVGSGVAGSVFQRGGMRHGVCLFVDMGGARHYSMTRVELGASASALSRQADKRG